MTNGPSTIPEPDQIAENQEKSDLRNLARWLLLVPIVLVTLLCCGQLALYGISPPMAKDTGSNLEADYGIWAFSVIPQILPEIINEIREDRGIPDEIVVPGRVWPLLPQLPTKTPPPTATVLPEPADTAAPERPTLTASIPPTATSSPSITPTPTEIWVWIPSNTPLPTSPLPPTDIPDPTSTPSPIPTATTIPSETPSQTPSDIPTSTDTLTPSLTPSETPTLSETPTPSLTPSDTATATDTLTPSETPTETPTLTSTPDLCPGNIPPGEPNVGPSNNVFAEIPCGGVIILDLVALGSPPVDTTMPDPDYDLRYYERTVPGDPAQIAFDWVTLQVGTGPSGSCSAGTWYTAMVWGDGNAANNGHLGASYPENDNERIPTSTLHGWLYQTGISIDLDALGIPNQVYPCVMIISPVNWPDNDGSEVDAIEVLP